jgi:ABC-type Fe3+/spermidine/putrescine transport system ATPase subunit
VAVVRIERLRKSFAGRTVLDLDELDIHDGEFFSLLGPSGCGKTTTLRSIAGLVEPDGGRVFIGGRDMTAVPTWQRNLGMVFQKYALFPHLTIAENIAYGLEERRLPRADITKRIAEALSLVALSGTEHRYPHQLSGGQQQRVAMARAVVYRPDVLLLDEPLSNLDVKLRVAMRAELKRLQQAVGITTIFVTHDQHEALALSDRIGVMRDGRMDQVGTPQEIYDRPQSVFVADFVGGTNLLQGVIRQADATAGTLTIEVEGSGLVMLNMTRPLETRQPVRIAAKPERVALEQLPAVTDGLRGTIDSAAYLGAGYSYVIGVGTQKLEARRATPLSIDGYPAAPGERVLVTLDPESTQVFEG